MEPVLAIVGVALLGLAGFAVFRARQGGGERREPAQQLSPADERRALDGDVRTLAPGDVVNHEGIDFLIERTMVFDEDGFQWREHRLNDPVSGRAMWLSVEEDEGVEVGLYERLTGVALEPGPKELAHEGVTYRLDEKGSARYTTDTGSGPGESGSVEYADYVAGERRLSLERYGTGGWEASTGVVVPEHALDIYKRG